MNPLLEPGSPPHTIVELLRSRREDERDLYIFLEEGERVGASLSRKELDFEARRLAGWLRTRTQPGDRVLLVFPSGLDYLVAFFGCLYAGVIAIPAYPPRRNQRATRLLSIVADSESALVLTTTEQWELLSETIAMDPGLSGLHWQTLESIPKSAAEKWQPVGIGADTVAFLQYTSGSTGSPKGVAVTHGNLIDNQRLVFHCFRAGWGATQVGWLPLHHDMGLIGNVLHPLFLGGRLVFMSPIDFLQRPIRWLRAIADYGGVLSGGPNFAYRLCVEQITEEQCEGLDLSNWHVAFNGAEPIDASVLEHFAKKFAPYGFRREQFCPCYGMAESTLLITGAVRGEPVVTTPAAEGSRPLVACGAPDASVDLRIVDPATCRELPAGSEGEIWVSGRSVAAGYWQRPDVNDAVFHARIQGGGATSFSRDARDDAKPSSELLPAQSEAGYLRTGDLGMLRDGQLYVTGRLKDLIILNGVNFYPQDLERTVEQSHPSLTSDGGAAFSIEVEGNEQVVLIQEVRRVEMRTLDPDQVMTAILDVLSREHQLSPHTVLLTRPGSTPKTTSGKVQRSLARERFLSGDIPAIATWSQGELTIHQKRKRDRKSTQRQPSTGPQRSGIAPNSSAPQTVASSIDASGVHAAASAEDTRKMAELRQWLIAQVSARTGLPAHRIDPNEPLARYGLNSIAAAGLSSDLSDHLGRNIPITLAYDYPTIDRLAAFLVTGNGRDTQPTVVRSEGSSDRSTEAIAVVGIGCRLPGAGTPDAFWQLLSEGRDCIGEPPATRWCPVDVEPAEGQPTRAGYLSEVDRFDSAFFGINRREADAMDPQQRLLLEVAWHAFEDAGMGIERLAGQPVGVFVGASNYDYARMEAAANVRSLEDGYRATGNSLAMASNRLSYAFDFIGPSLTIDTACSSSLVSVHQAISSIRRGECKLAVAGGINLLLSTDATRCLWQAGMLSETGTCRPFDAGANGFVRGEGCGLVVLKPLQRALDDGDRIYSVVLGTAVNQDGRTNGLTAPSRHSQRILIESACSDAGVDPTAVDYLEAHGTGTELGDPIEMGAILDVFGRRADEGGRERQEIVPLRIGAVKANIGHLEAAAGIAGFIKVCLSLYHEKIAPQLNFECPSKHIAWDQGVEVSSDAIDWPTNQRKRVAGVSSFGFGGANAHVVLAESPLPQTHTEEASTAAGDLPAAFIPLSAKSADALRQLAHVVADGAGDASLSDISHTLTRGRSSL